jgi:predicted RNA binding protein YcfA (HicA-like mRNA interferase family)
MPKLPSLTGKQLIAALSTFGFEVVRTRGSHNVLRHSDGRATTVPTHAGETIGSGLLGKILRDCEISREQLSQAL